MPDPTITLVSTTDPAEDVQAAMTGAPKAAATPPAADTPPPAVDPKAAEPTPPVETEAQKSAREKRQERIQADIDELTRKKHEARRDADAEEARLKALRDELTALAAKGITTPPAAEPPAPAAAKPTEPAVTVTPDRPEPQVTDTNADGSAKYANYEQYLSDHGAWTRELTKKEAAAIAAAQVEAYKRERDQKDAEERDRIARDAATRAATEAFAKHNAAIEEFRKTHADFDAVMGDVADVVTDMKSEYARATGQPGERLFEVIDKFTVEDASNSAALVYHLAQNPDEMRRIVRLPVPQQLIALGRLDSRLEGAAPPQPGPSAKVPPTTKAPEPIKPVGGGPTAPPVPPDEEDYQAYKARRQREERQRAGLPVNA